MMQRFPMVIILAAISFVSLSSISTQAQTRSRTAARPTSDTVIWRDPGAVDKLDLGGGPGGRDGVPVAPFRFEEEDFGGSNPKIKVIDSTGRHWGVKWGSEVNSEVFASRIAWAAGYFVEPAYFVARGRIENLPSSGLKRARKSIGSDGSFVNARFELKEDGVEKRKDKESWAWNNNPFVGTKQLNGLKVVLMFVSNWDSKDQRDAGRGSNTAIYRYTLTGGRSETRYIFSDWGGSMGKWGGVFSREKWQCKGFAAQTKDFIKGVGPSGIVEFGYSGQRTSDVAEGITAQDVRFVYERLGQLSNEQLRDGLRAAGASEADVECFVSALRERLTQMAEAAAMAGK